MSRVVGMIVGGLLFVAPLMWLSSLVPVARYRTGTFADLEFAVIAGTTLYGGVLAGAFSSWRLEVRRGAAVKGLGFFFAGWVGAMVAIGLALGIWAVREWLTTGAVVRPGQSLALLPIFPIIGGLLSLPIAGGAGLVLPRLRRPTV